MSELVNRFKEPSSYAGVAFVIDGVSHAFGAPVGIGAALVNVAMAVCGLIAFFVKEKK